MKEWCSAKPIITHLDASGNPVTQSVVSVTDANGNPVTGNLISGLLDNLLPNWMSFISNIPMQQEVKL